MRYASILLLLLGLTAAAYLFTKPESPTHAPTQTAFARAHSGTKDVFVRQLCLLSAEDLAMLPTIDGFEYPCGTAQGAFFYDAQAMGTPNAKRGGMHLGSDLNGIGGGASDEGEPVYAMGRGLVVYSGCPAEAWGNVVVLAHRCPDGRIIQSLYAHLKELRVKRGTLLARGQQLGTIGGADGQYVPHLHLELIESLRIEAGLPAYLDHHSPAHLSLQEVMQQYPAPVVRDCYQSIRRQAARSTIELRPVSS
ncbi:MAG: M23 family metallopeptidase [Akkermansia sp.]